MHALWITAKRIVPVDNKNKNKIRSRVKLTTSRKPVLSVKIAEKMKTLICNPSLAGISRGCWTAIHRVRVHRQLLLAHFALESRHLKNKIMPSGENYNRTNLFVLECGVRMCSSQAARVTLPHHRHDDIHLLLVQPLHGLSDELAKLNFVRGPYYKFFYVSRPVGVECSCLSLHLLAVLTLLVAPRRSIFSCSSTFFCVSSLFPFPTSGRWSLTMRLSSACLFLPWHSRRQIQHSNVWIHCNVELSVFVEGIHWMLSLEVIPVKRWEKRRYIYYSDPSRSRSLSSLENVT